MAAEQSFCSLQEQRNLLPRWKEKVASSAAAGRLDAVAPNALQSYLVSHFWRIEADRQQDVPAASTDP